MMRLHHKALVRLTMGVKWVRQSGGDSSLLAVNWRQAKPVYVTGQFVDDAALNQRFYRARLQP